MMMHSRVLLFNYDVTNIRWSLIGEERYYIVDLSLSMNLLKDNMIYVIYIYIYVDVQSSVKIQYMNFPKEYFIDKYQLLV